MDPYLAIASKRDERSYADTPVPPEVRQRILDAGRLTGSSRNRQPWEFVVVSGPAQGRLAETVYAPENVRGAALVVAIAGEASGFDAGRCSQNMMLAAWGEGVVSCPNGLRDADAAAEICGGAVRALLSFGYPVRPRDPESRSAEEWSARANRKPLSELVREVG
jgi:nitroreductase